MIYEIMTGYQGVPRRPRGPTGPEALFPRPVHQAAITRTGAAWASAGRC